MGTTKSDRLPPRLFKGRTVFVLPWAREHPERHRPEVIIDFDLWFGIHGHKRVIIEGIDVGRVNAAQRGHAQHCLVVLLGGKRLLVKVADPRVDGSVLGRVYLDEKVYHKPAGLVEVSDLLGDNRERLEIGTYFDALIACNFDVGFVHKTLNGK